jgi:hypothetical protein
MTTNSVAGEHNAAGSTSVGPEWAAAYDTVVVVGGISWALAGVIGRAARPVAAFVLHPPMVPKALHPARGVEALVRLGSREGAHLVGDLEDTMVAVVPAVVERILQRLPLTELVQKHVDIDALVAGVDLDAVVARIDLDAIAQRLDIDAIIARVDLVGLADQVIEGIDLPEIIRESTGTVASEVVRGVRMQSIDADEAIARVVDRLFLRRRQRATDAPGEPLSLDEIDGVTPSTLAAGDGVRPQGPT